MLDFTSKLKPAEDGGAILAVERGYPGVAVEKLSEHLFSRDGFLERQERIVRLLQTEPLFNKANQLNFSRPERYHLGLARAKALRRMAVGHAWDEADYRMAEYLTDEMSPYLLHLSMFRTTIKEQGSDKQQKHWMPLVENWEIIGCYGQTELGHGSNVRGLETEAKWDPKSKEFIIHSPTLTSSKWWNGALGRTATHAVVVAQLLLPANLPINGRAQDVESIKYVSHGPHPFLFRIRDPHTHQPLKGIVIGDIGPKYGYTSMDNGYMLFNHFRIPHDAMLSRYNRVDPSSGSLTRLGHPAVVYGSLTHFRANIVMHARLVLARSVTIAIRYCAIRKQFSDRDIPNADAPEMAVLDYPTVQVRLLPLLATTFALHYTGEAMFTLYWKTRDKIENGDFSDIAELHSTSSGLKSLCTMLAADGIETCRRACGGHGFGGGSGFIPVNNDYLSKPTVEGDNWMITQQAASYLIKRMENVIHRPEFTSKDGAEEIFRRYLKTRSNRARVHVISNGSIDNKHIVDAFEWRAAHLSYEAYEARVVRQRKWNSLLIQLHQLSKSYSEMILIQNFFNALHAAQLPQETANIMSMCFQLFALHTLQSDAMTFVTSRAVAMSSFDELPNSILELMGKIRPHAVNLVDAWKVPDYLLQSALGRYDGKVYEELFDMAHRRNPLNNVTFNPDWRSDEIVLGSKDGGKHILSKL